MSFLHKFLRQFGTQPAKVVSDAACSMLIFILPCIAHIRGDTSHDRHIVTPPSLFFLNCCLAWCDGGSLGGVRCDAGQRVHSTCERGARRSHIFLNCKKKFVVFLLLVTAVLRCFVISPPVTHIQIVCTGIHSEYKTCHVQKYEVLEHSLRSHQVCVCLPAPLPRDEEEKRRKT